jgi:hypothetical protein
VGSRFDPDGKRGKGGRNRKQVEQALVISQKERRKMRIEPIASDDNDRRTHDSQQDPGQLSNQGKKPTGG